MQLTGQERRQAMTNRMLCIFVTLLSCMLGSRATNVARFDYADALKKSLMFFQAQKSGKLSANYPIKWRGNSGLSDGFLQGVSPLPLYLSLCVFLC